MYAMPHTLYTDTPTYNLPMAKDVMRFMPQNPPRIYTAGFEHKVSISDCGRLELNPDEQVTFTTPMGGEYDLTRKEWGFYATPSTNGRLASFSLRTLLVRNRLGKCFVLLVEKGKEDVLTYYLELEKMDILCWLDTDQAVQEIVGVSNHASRS